MWFLTKLWAPWWIFCILGAITEKNDHRLSTQGPLATIELLWMCVNFFVTVIYIGTRVFRRATRESEPHR